jgi:vitellogenic carboxypeptidase-like protein
VYRQFAEVSGDFMVGVRKEIEALLSSGIRMMVYHGAVDAICGAVTGDALVHSLQWEGAAEFAAASRVTWKVDKADDASAGWVVESDKTNLAWVVLRDAGHLVPFDQPRSAWAMMDRFVNGMPIASA